MKLMPSNAALANTEENSLSGQLLTKKKLISKSFK